MNYSKLVKQLTAEMKKGVQYKDIPKVFKIFLIIAMIPLIVSFVISKLVFGISLFVYRIIAAPADYLNKWLKAEKSDVMHLTQAVMYLVAFPTIFGLQVILSLNSVFFFLQWFGMMIQAYLLTLGGIKWQPFLTEAEFGGEEAEYVTKPNRLIKIIFACIVFGAAALWVLLTLISLIAKGNFLIFISGFAAFIAVVYWIFVAIVNPCVFKVISKK